MAHLCQTRLTLTIPTEMTTVGDNESQSIMNLMCHRSPFGECDHLGISSSSSCSMCEDVSFATLSQWPLYVLHSFLLMSWFVDAKESPISPYLDTPTMTIQITATKKNLPFFVMKVSFVTIIYATISDRYCET